MKPRKNSVDEEGHRKQHREEWGGAGSLGALSVVTIFRSGTQMYRRLLHNKTKLSSEKILRKNQVFREILEFSALVDGHGGDHRLDVANVGQPELEAYDVRPLAAQLLVHALLEPGWNPWNKTGQQDIA